MSNESGWTAEALDYALQHNLEQQGLFAADLLRLDQVPFEQRTARYRQTYTDLLDTLDGLQAEFVRLNEIDPMR